jgi:hypothetical protein
VPTRAKLKAIEQIFTIMLRIDQIYSTRRMDGRRRQQKRRVAVATAERATYVGPAFSFDGRQSIIPPTYVQVEYAFFSCVLASAFALIHVRVRGTSDSGG